MMKNFVLILLAGSSTSFAANYRDGLILKASLALAEQQDVSVASDQVSPVDVRIQVKDKKGQPTVTIYDGGECTYIVKFDNNLDVKNIVNDCD